MRILGVDPGTLAMGWALLETAFHQPASPFLPAKQQTAKKPSPQDHSLVARTLQGGENLSCIHGGYSPVLGVRLVATGCLMPPKTSPLPQRLAYLHQQIWAIFDQTTPHAVALERVFVGTNAQAALALGYARALVLAKAGLESLPIGEYAPTQAKQALVGSGRADKAQMVAMVAHFFGIQVRHDSADAIALALCHSQQSRFQGTLAGRF